MKDRQGLRIPSERISRIILFWLIAFASGMDAAGQQVPSRPLSNPVYSPIVINPAFVGSKDFTNISLTSKVLKSPDSQFLNIHKRLTDKEDNYSRVGLGSYLFHELLEESRNTGLAFAGSYHIPLDQANIHNLSLGASVKGIFNIPIDNGEGVGDSLGNELNPNLDLGVYYYGPSAFAGLSVTSLLGTDTGNGPTVRSEAFVPREYHLYGGYKILLNRQGAIVLEPSLLVSLDDSTLSEPQKHLTPYLKLYLKDFYIGTHFRSLDQIAVFFQYQFPRLYTGVFLEFPRGRLLNDENIIFELILGLNLGRGGPGFLQYRHW